MTQPIMWEGRWAVSRDGTVAGKLVHHPRQSVYVWSAGLRTFTKNGRYYPEGNSVGDIIATFSTEDEARAFAVTINTVKEPAMPEPTQAASDIEWASLGVDAENEATEAIILAVSTDTKGKMVAMEANGLWSYLTPDNARLLSQALTHFAGRAQRNGGGE